MPIMQVYANGVYRNYFQRGLRFKFSKYISPITPVYCHRRPQENRESAHFLRGRPCCGLNFKYGYLANRFIIDLLLWSFIRIYGIFAEAEGYFQCGPSQGCNGQNQCDQKRAVFSDIFFLGKNQQVCFQPIEKIKISKFHGHKRLLLQIAILDSTSFRTVLFISS